MKFDPSTISAKKRAEWQQIEQQCALNSPEVRAPATHNGERLLWFVGSELHCDGYVFAQAYALPIDASQSLISERVHKLFGEITIVFDQQLSM